MKKLFTGCATALLAFGCNGGSDSSELENGFRQPPADIKTAAYWYWISGHVSKEGVVKDLESMKEAGIGRAFIGDIGLPEYQSGQGAVEFGSDEWWEIMHAALKTATDLGIEIGIFNSPGWSQSGGPWVAPERAMRYLASTSTRIAGGGRVETALPRPNKPGAENFKDVKVIAYPAPEGVETAVFDGLLSASADGGMQAEITTAEPFTLRGLKIRTNTAPIDKPTRIEAMTPDGYRTLAEFRIARYNPSLSVGFDPYAPVVVSVPATTSTAFRFVVEGAVPADAIRLIELSSAPLVESYPEKSLAKMYQQPLPYWDEYMWREQPAPDAAASTIAPETVIDISQYLDGDMLTWDAPAGDWIVMRTGMLPTGVTNGPALGKATGLETDKMSREHIEAHFDAYMGEILRRIPAEDRRCWKVVVQDSYETGGQNFTDTFLEDFEARYGYSAVPYLPVYEGVVVGSEDLSDRFLWDVRRFVADKVAYDYVGGLRDVCHRHGLTTWLENYGHWGFPGEFLMYGGQSDEIGGEFWSEGSLGDIENRAASSCGHIYGKTRIWAESFTAGGGGYHRYPEMIKRRGDRFFTEGINSTLLHVVISQPYEDREPGVNTWFGIEFNRKNTWFPHLHLFTDYLKRVNFMLQQGLNVADAAYYIGEDAPKMTGVTDPALPAGYQFDYINAEVLVRDAFVRDGLLTLPHGTQYRILVLPRQTTMRPEVAAKIERLINDGAVVLGPAPERSPSMQNYPEADMQVAGVAKRLWSKIDPATKYARIGKGMLINGMGTAQAFGLIGCTPDITIGADEPLLYGHRKADGTEIYFVSNQSDEEITVAPVFRVKSMQPELWDPVTGDIRRLPSFSRTDDGTAVPLKFAPGESVFVVFRDKDAVTPQVAPAHLNYAATETIAEIGGAWNASFQPERRGPSQSVVMDRLRSLTEFDDFDIKYYSGMIRYENGFTLESVPEGRLFLDLGSVAFTAKVWINGNYAGGAWTAPWRTEITGLVREGRNDLKIEVATTWKNRIIGDARLPQNERLTWYTSQTWGPDSELSPAGLLGPVTLERAVW